MKNNPLPLFLDSAGLQRILDILNIVWISLFIGVLVILVLLFLRGLLRGWKYGTYRIVFMGILIAVALLIIGPVSNGLGNMDVSGFNIPAIHMDLGDGKTVDATWTTPLATLTDMFEQLLKASGVTSGGNAAFNYAFALALSVVKLVLIFVFALIISTLGVFLCWLFWILIFRRIFIPKDKRKIKKLRIISAFEEFIIGGVLLAMFLVPFTGVANALANHAKFSKEQAEKNETAQMVYAVVDSYENSVFSKVFFSWTKFNGEDSLDTRLASFLTHVDYEGASTDFIHELSAIADVGSSLIEDGLLEALGDNAFQWALILGSSMVPNLLDNLLATDLVKTVLPVGMELAIHLDSVKDVLGEDTVNWLSDNSVKWTDELGNVAKLYRKLLEADVFDCLVPDIYTQTPVFNLRDLYKLFDESGDQNAFHEAMSIADSAVVNHLLAGLVHTLASKNEQAKDDDPGTLQLIDFLPVDSSGAPDYSKMASLSWFSELGIVYDTLYKMVGISKSEMKEIFDELPNDLGAPKSKRLLAETSENGSSFLSQAFTDKLTSFAIDHAAELVDCLVGERDANGHPIQIDAETGISTGNAKNFLDSALIYNALPSLVPFLGASLTNAGLTADLSEAQAKLIDTSAHNLRYNFKQEFGAMFDFIVKMTETEAGKAFLKNMDSLAGIEFDPDGKLHSMSSELVKTLQSSLYEIDDSAVLSCAVPQISEKLINDAVDLSSFFELKPDFYCDNFGRELGNLLDIVIDCPHVLRDFAGLSGGNLPLDTVTDIVIEDQDEFSIMLETIAESAIFNPIDPNDGKANKNFCSLLNNVFSQVSADMDKLTPEDLDGVKLVSDRDASGNILAKGECARIVDVLAVIASSGVLSEISGSSSSDVGKLLKKIDIPATFNAIGASVVFAKLGGSLFDSFFSDVIGASELGLGQKVSFRNVNTKQEWENEADGVGAIVEIASNGLDLANIDFFKDAATFGPMLEALSKSGMFLYHDSATDADEYCFPEYLYNKLINSVSGDNLAYFADDGVTSEQLNAATTLAAKRDITTSLYDDMVVSLPSREDWVGEAGEMKKINRFLIDIGRQGGLESFESFSAESMNGLRVMLGDIAVSDAFGRTILKNGLKKAMTSINAGSEFDFSAANTSYFAKPGVNAEMRVAEVNAMMDAIEPIYDPSYGMVTGSNFDSSKMNLSSLSVDYFLRPTLEGMAESKVLSTVEEGSGKLSIHDQTCCLLMRKAGLYSVAEDNVIVDPGHADITIRGIVESVSDWDATVNDLCDALTLLQKSSLINGGEIDLSSLSDPKEYFGGDSITRERRSAELKEILAKLNRCELTYRALPTKLDESLAGATHILGGEFDGTFIEASNPYYKVKTVSYGHDLDRYPDEEVEHLIDSLADMALAQNMKSTDISTVNPDTLAKLLDDMMMSGVFNSLKEGEELTAFQGLLTHVVGIDALNDYLYLVPTDPNAVSSPKDLHFKSAGIYASAAEKAKYLVKLYAGARYDDDLTAQHALIGGESNSIRSTLRLFVSDEMSELLSGSGLSFDKLSPNSLANILNELNGNSFYYDCVPNVLAKLSSDSSFAIDGIDLKVANYFHPYYFEAGHHRASTEYSARYTSDEIYNVASLFNLIKKTKDTLGGSFNIKSIDHVSLRNLLLDLDNSIVFHNEGRRDDCLAATSVSYAGGQLKFNDLTVFEQIVYLAYDKSSIASLTYDRTTDLALYLEHGDNGYQLKKHDEIANFNQANWTEQIVNLTDLISVVQTSSLVDSSGNLSMDTDSIKALTPDELIDILDAINKDDLACDLIQISLRDLFSSSGSGIGLDKYTAYSFDPTVSGVNEYTPSIYGASQGLLGYSITSMEGSVLSGAPSSFKIYGDIAGDGTFSDDVTALCQVQWSGDDFVVKPGDVYCAIKLVSDVAFNVSGLTYDMANYYYGQAKFEAMGSPVLRKLLNSFYNSSTHEYFEFTGSGDDLKNFRSGGHSTVGLLDFFHSYPAYEMKVSNAYLPSESGSFTAGEYGFYNLMTIEADIGGYITQTVEIGGNILNNASASKAERLVRLRSLWTNPSYDPAAEAVWFDAHVVDAGTLTVFNVGAPSINDGMQKAAINAVLMGQADQFISLITSLSDGASHDNLFLAPEIVSGLMQNYVRAQRVWVLQDEDYFTRSGHANTASRIDMVRSSELPYGDVDYDYSITFDNGPSALSTIIATTFAVEKAIVDSDFVNAATEIAKLSNASGVSLSSADILYLGSIYDLLLLSGKFTYNYGIITDLPSPKLDAANNYVNSATPSVITDFYATVASIL